MDRDPSSHDQDILDILKGLESKKAEYPAELLAARRKLFLKQLEQRTEPRPAIEPTASEHRLLGTLRGLKAFEPEYPPLLLTRRRFLYKQQARETLQHTVWQLLRSSFQGLFAGGVSSHGPVSTKLARAATLAVSAAMIAFVAFALRGTTLPSNSFAPSLHEIFTPTSGPATPAAQAVLICEDGYEPPLCLTKAVDSRDDLTYAGNGKARPAVAKDSLSGSGQIHRASHVNDGLYGPDASWVSNSPNSWIKIDLGTPTNINAVAFGRDRLGNLNDGDPGQFIIAVAVADDVYADGNSSNDEIEYMQVYDSEQAGFDGTISGAETVVALFDMKQARFIKITFENAFTAIDEVDAFVSDPAVVANLPTKQRPQKEEPPIVSTPVPSDTLTAVPIDTLPPTDAITSIPTDPPTPVETPTPIDTVVPIEPTIPPATDTPFYIPTYPPTEPPTQEPVPTVEPINVIP